MRLTKIVDSGCQGSTCPAVYRADDGSFVVQGTTITAAEGLTLPAHESAVQIPASLVDELVRAVTG